MTVKLVQMPKTRKRGVNKKVQTCVLRLQGYISGSVATNFLKSGRV